jgi:hypothetical protein
MAALLVVVTVVVGINAGWGWAVAILGVAWLVAAAASAPPRPAAPPKPKSPPPCGGIAGGCPVCLAASIAIGVVVGDWLSGD